MILHIIKCKIGGETLGVFFCFEFNSCVKRRSSLLRPGRVELRHNTKVFFSENTFFRQLDNSHPSYRTLIINKFMINYIILTRPNQVQIQGRLYIFFRPLCVYIIILWWINLTNICLNINASYD